MSLKYFVLKGAMKTFRAQKLMAKEPKELQKIFRNKNKKPIIPKLSDSELTISIGRVKGFPVLHIRHRRPSDAVLVYVVGGGMLKYPTPKQAKEMIGLAKKTGRNIVLPYYPLCYEHGLPDVFDMLYQLYKKLLTKYSSDNILFLGGSSGGFHTLALISHINAKKEGLPMPGKLYLSSPGTMFPTKADRERAMKKDKTDLIMSVKAMDNICRGMTHGKHVPDYMLYLQKGDYTGLKDVYMSFGGDEVFCASANAIKNRLELYDVHVTLEIAQGMYHCYAALPLVKEAKQGYQNMITYCKV